jgi:hypothetical protein
MGTAVPHTRHNRALPYPQPPRVQRTPYVRGSRLRRDLFLFLLIAEWCFLAITLNLMSDIKNKRVRIDAMHERHHALTHSLAGTLEEAASVCLSRFHVSPVEIRIFDNGEGSSAELHWNKPDARAKGAWANDTDATELGACACVIAGVELVRGRYAVRRAETGTGADYYIGASGAGEVDLEDCLRLEVSGVSDGDEKDINRRLLEKVRQASRGESSLPALAGVIGFSSKVLMLKDVPEEL